MVKVPKGYRSRNVEDRRGRRGGGGGGFGFPRRRRSGGGGLGGSLGGRRGGGLGDGGGLGGSLGGGVDTGRRRKGCGGGIGLALLVVFALLLFSCLGGGDLTPGSNGGADLTGPAQGGSSSRSNAEVDAAYDLVNFVLDDVQEYWTGEFEADGQTYPVATLVIFDQGQVRTGGCGTASSAVGPFYCPADSKAYIDIEYMLRLQDQLDAEGDFSQAYILAHEIGHHVQNVLGTSDAVRRAQSGASRAESNELSVRLELQADCLAGMWARDAERDGILDTGDLAEGLNAASAVGDDSITGSANQENFTHGSSAQRVRWFRAGYDSGRYDSCDTFSVPSGSL